MTNKMTDESPVTSPPACRARVKSRVSAAEVPPRMTHPTAKASDEAFLRSLEELVWEMDADPAPVGESTEQNAVGVASPECDGYLTRSTRAAWLARGRMKKNEAALRRYARHVRDVDWKDGPVPEFETWKKFPFSLKRLNSSELKSASVLKGEEELFPRQVPLQLMDLPEVTSLPHWKNLPGKHRCGSLNEILVGLRIASLFYGDSASLASWWGGPPSEDCCALSIDLRGDDARRFLLGERGSGSVALHRRVRRPVERFLGDVALGAVWAGTPDGDDPRVCLYLFLRSESLGSALDAIEVDRSNRYVRSLRKHAVPLPPDDMPIWINNPSDKAAYFGVSIDELERRWDLWPGDDEYISEVDEQEFSPETGFVSASVIEEREANSRDRWRRIAAHHRLPVWFSDRLARCLRDQLMPRVEPSSWRAPIALNIYRGSPACLAAVAARSGPVLGDYFDSRHKGAVARKLYDELRSLHRGR